MRKKFKTMIKDARAPGFIIYKADVPFSSLGPHSHVDVSKERLRRLGGCLVDFVFSVEIPRPPGVR